MGHIDVKVVKMSYYDIYMGHNKYFFGICPDRRENGDII